MGVLREDELMEVKLRSPCGCDVQHIYQSTGQEGAKNAKQVYALILIYNTYLYLDSAF